MSHWRIIIPISIGTGLSLIGDSSLYTVLPTHLDDAGITLATIGIVLSANRFIRLFLNGPMGWIYDRSARRKLFIPSLFLGALSTFVYAVAPDFLPLLLGRLLWGLAWAGIWVGGNTIVLDITDHGNRGRWVGIYQVSFFLGAASGAILGGVLTDWLGYRTAMALEAALSLAGATYAWIGLPETSGFRTGTSHPQAGSVDPVRPAQVRKHQGSIEELLSAISLMGVNRIAAAGILPATLGLYLLQQFGDTITAAPSRLGIASLTGLGLGGTTLLAMLTVPIVGRVSDRVPTRWQIIAVGLVAGLSGYMLLSIGSPATIIIGLLLAAVMSGSNTGLSTALVGDLVPEGKTGRFLGVLFTVGDLGSALGPLVVFALLPYMDIQSIYIITAALLLCMALISGLFAYRRSRHLIVAT